MRAAGKIVDPHTWARYALPDGKPGLLGRFVMWSRRAAETSHTEGVLRQQLAKKFMKDNFNHGLFLTTSGDDFRSLLAAFSTGSVTALDKRVGPMLTEPVRSVLVRGMEESRAENGGYAQGVEVLQSLEASYVSARLIYPPVTASAPGMTQRPTHAQITTQHKLLVRPIAVAPEGAAGSGLASAGKGGSAKSKISSLIQSSPPQGRARPSSAASPSSASFPASSSSLADEGFSSSGSDVEEGSDAALFRAKREQEWESILDERTGLIYWALGSHRSGLAGFTGAAGAAGDSSGWIRSWTPPQPQQLLPRRPWRIETAGIEREPVIVAASSSGGQVEDRLVRVSFRVTWERAIPPPGPAAEAAAASPATARWRVVRLL